jgi:hypothetical protein
MESFLRGVLAGGTVAYLHRTAERQAGQRSGKTYGTLALEVNHLFYLAVIVLRHARAENSRFDFFAKTAFMLAPAFLGADFLRSKISFLEGSMTESLSYLYYLASFVSAIVLLGLGKKQFALGALAMLVMDVAVHNQQVKRWECRMFEAAAKVAAVTAFIGYGAWIVASKNALEKNLMILASGLIFLPKIWNFFFPKDPPRDPLGVPPASDGPPPPPHRPDPHPWDAPDCGSSGRRRPPSPSVPSDDGRPAVDPSCAPPAAALQAAWLPPLPSTVFPGSAAPPLYRVSYPMYGYGAPFPGPAAPPATPPHLSPMHEYGRGYGGLAQPSFRSAASVQTATYSPSTAARPSSSSSSSFSITAFCQRLSEPPPGA